MTIKIVASQALKKNTRSLSQRSRQASTIRKGQVHGMETEVWLRLQRGHHQTNDAAFIQTTRLAVKSVLLDGLSPKPLKVANSTL